MKGQTRKRFGISANLLSAIVLAISMTIALPAISAGPILIISSASNPFSSYYTEILRTEGFSEFDVSDISSISLSMLASHDIVIIGDMPLTTSQVAMLSDWVTGGGRLIAMRPDKKLTDLLGLTDLSSTLSNAYLLVNTSSGPGAGVVGQTMQFHGTADRYSLNGASAVATLYSSSTTATTSPAVTLINVGANGGQAAAFVYDLARSVVYTRQGNPAWAGQERDGSPPIRSDDLFYGPADFDPQPNWVDLNKVAIPQADEQQRLLANLVIRMNAGIKPLPRFWYFPRNLTAVVVMTGDDHGSFYGGGATAKRFDQFLAASPSGCIDDNWECVRGTAYLFPPNVASNPLTNSQASSYNNLGFEVALHVDTGCEDWTPSMLESFYSTQLASWRAKYTSLPQPVTNRTHCISWSDYVTQAQVELNHGIRFDTNYYYWPPEWVNDRPGFFIGSGIPMRFADANGNLIDVYQAATQMTDESEQSYPYTIDTLLDRATGPQGYYGAFTVNAHNDSADSDVADAVVSSALARGVPVITSRQMLNWLDGRNASTFDALVWNGSSLDFNLNVGQGATGLIAMVPVLNGQSVTGITRDGNPVSFTSVTVKGIPYVRFTAASGFYQVNYENDLILPRVSSVSPVNSATGTSVTSNVSATFSEGMDSNSINSGTFELSDPSGNLVPAAISYDAATVTGTLDPTNSLAQTTAYTATVKGGASGVKDIAGNPMDADFKWSFTTGSAPAGPFTIWPSTTVPGVADSGPDSAVELGVKFRSDSNGYITGIRFYKGSGNTGTHVGNLWTSTGTRLATANFSNETATGWQQVNFSSPVAITANTIYVASYHTNVGHYSDNQNYFASAGVDNPPLHALANGVSGYNGVYAYGSSSSFPNQGWNSSNYWVDVVFSANTQTTTLSSISVTPANPTISVGAMQQFTATGTYSDGSTQNITSQVTWSSSNTGIATITAAGLATGAAAGTSNITAALNGVTGGATLTVQSDPVTLASISVTPANPTISVGATQQFTATGTYSGGGTQNITSQVTWSSSNTGIATINTAGLATGTSAGTSNISASLSGVTGATTLTVQAVALTITTATLPGGMVNTPYSATLTASGGTSPYSWSIANGSLPSGLVLNVGTGVISGTPTTTGTFSFTVGVTDSAAQSATRALSISVVAVQTSSTIWPSTTVPGVADAGPDSAVEIGVKFRSDSNGYINGIRFYKGSGNTGTHVGNLWTSTGTRLATANFSNETATGWQQVNFSSPVAITANTVYVASYHTNVGHYSINQNYFASSGVDNPPLHALANGVSGVNGVFAYGSSSSFPNQGWNSSNYWVDVLFSANTQTTTLSSISVTPANPTITVGATQQFIATGTYSDSSTQNITAQVAWSSSNISAATITSAGLATGAAAGTSNISASLSGVTGGTALTVQAAPPTLSSISVTPVNPTINIGATQQFTATGTYSDGSTQNITAQVSWSSSNTSAATITAAGLATGAAAGTSNISASLSGVTGGTTLTVQSAPVTLSTISVTPVNPTITIGATQQFTATGTYSDGSTQNITAQVAWSSSNISVATITAAGLATGAAAGTSNISASLSGVTGGTTLTVQSAPVALSSISVTPANPTITVGATQQFTATGTYSDGSTQNISTQVTWVSANTGVATISAAGLATGSAAGTSSISATQGAVTGSTTLTVQPLPLTITTNSLPTARTGVPYSRILAASGGTPPYIWSISSGSLPPGLSLDAGTGVISGTPTSTGTFSFTVRATDSGSPTQSATRNLSIRIRR